MSEQSIDLFKWAAGQFIAIEKALALTIIGVQPTDYWLFKRNAPDEIASWDISIHSPEWRLLRQSTIKALPNR